jgi:hypothetical protein
MTLTREDIEARVKNAKSNGAATIGSAELIELCTLALSALEMQPRPIADAPKDGSSMILIDGKGAAQGFWMEEVDSDHDTPGFPACWSNMSGDVMEPSRFIPLSSLPKVQSC